MGKLLRVSVCAVLVLIALGRVVSAEPVAALGPASDPVPLVLGVLPAADSLALHLAAEEGLFAARGLTVRLVPFQSAFELAAAVRGKAVDGYFGDLINVLLLHASGMPQRLVAVSSHASRTADTAGPRHFGIVVPASSSAHTLQDLAGGDVAIGRASIVDFMLDRMLARAGLPSEFVRHVDIRQIPVRLQLLSAGKLAAAVLPEPLVSLLEAQGARVIADDRGLDVPLAVIAWNADQVSPQRIAAFQAALAEAMARINAHPADWQPLMLAKGLLPRGAGAHYRMVSFDPSLMPTPLPTAVQLENYANWMRERGVLRTQDDWASIVSTDAP